MRVLILSTVHPWNDPRIFHKQACTLAQEHEVILAAVDEGAERTIRRVRLRPLGIWKSRWDRPRLWIRALQELYRSRAEVVHFHDPELALLLLPWAWLSSRKFICDIHEHPYGAIRGKTWLPKFWRRAAAAIVSFVLRRAPYVYDQVILAEESYRPLFPPRANVHIVRNYARLPEPDLPFFNRFADFDPRQGLRLIYVGTITPERGAIIMAQALKILAGKYPAVTLDLIGPVRPPSLLAAMMEAAKPFAARLTLHGYLDQDALTEALISAHLGLVPLQQHPNYLESMPTKFFDYMIHGLPFVCSDFPLWSRFISENGCGLVANMADPEQLAQAIDELVQDPIQLQELSRNAYSQVRQHYLWKSEAEKLLQIYRLLQMR